jgi:hypothetical protein
MKTLPDSWTLHQKAFFAGLISAYVSKQHLQVVFSSLPTVKNDEACFDCIIAMLGSRINAERWKRLVAMCQRYFK